MSKQKLNKVLVIGDAMLDFHIYGSTSRISPEAPIPIVHADKEEKTLGAAANVAMHIASANLPCIFAYKHYQKEKHSHETFGQMCEGNLELLPLEYPGNHKVTTKTRIWSNGQQICRLDHENLAKPKEDLELGWFEKLTDCIISNNVSVVIMSDYNKGTLTDTLIMRIADFCKERNIPTILDPKRPTFHKIGDLTIVKPNIKELNSTNFTQEQCSRRLRNTYLINTLGSEGMVVFQNGHEIYRCPTIAQSVFDVTGCGDSVTALMGIMFYKEPKCDVSKIVKAANKAASYTIKHLGAYVLTKQEIEECIAYAEEKE